MNRCAAYVLLTHREPARVVPLVEAILTSSRNAHVFIAHDGRRFPAPTFDHPRVHVAEHGLATDWGSWELVLATLKGFAWARRVADPDLVVFISGEDHPTTNLGEWEARFLSDGGGWVGEAQPLAYRPRWGTRLGEGRDDLTRYTYAWFRMPRARWLDRFPSLRSAVHKIRGAALLRIEPILSWRMVARGRGSYLGVRRLVSPFSPSKPCYKGSQWLALDRTALDHLLDVSRRRDALRRLYERSIIPDESYIQTVLSWREPARSSAPLMFVRWIVEDDRPKVLGLEDLDDIVSSGAPFCRKVDPIVSMDLVGRLRELAGAGDLVLTAPPGIEQRDRRSGLCNVPQSTLGQ